MNQAVFKADGPGARSAKGLYMRNASQNMTAAIDPQRTVASLVLEHSECAEVFVRHRIDFCCRGNMSLEAAARAKELDVSLLLGQLTHAICDREGDAKLGAGELSTPRLVEHIVAKHHEYLRKTLPWIRALAEKVSRVHGERNPDLRELHAAVEELSAALLPHLDEEEQSLFPALCVASPDLAQIDRLLAAMADEHLDVARILERVRSAARDFAAPDWACNSYRTLLSELSHLERDTFTHVHLENHVLMPRFVAEGSLRG